ncbi:hypothetical protein OH807_04955 [Kitasatospora sp. NBC_01560]|uniref:hypothetical protein n=1 Tax=Kitasatospora sp. NBC_01560 TaxID=2975965 RepID=UPI00386DD469
MADSWAPERMPAAIRWAVAAVWLHAVLNGVAGLLLFALVSGDYGSDAGLVRFFAVLSLAIAVLLGGCAALAPRRARWTRTAVLAVEWLGVVSGLIQLFSGAFVALGGLAVSLLAIGAFASHRGRWWFNA